MMIQVQKEEFDVALEMKKLVGGHTSIGAIVTFVGLVRDMNSGVPILDLTLEHYPGMTQKMLQFIELEACARWPLCGSLIIHRYGELALGDMIVLVITTSAHRQAAFEANEFVVDWLKTKAPFWKRETTPKGKIWVSERTSDFDSMTRWTDRRNSD